MLVSIAVAQVSVQVLRNHAPTFQTTRIEKTIEESAGVQTSVADLVPFDEDRQVSLLQVVVKRRTSLFCFIIIISILLSVFHHQG